MILEFPEIYSHNSDMSKTWKKVPVHPLLTGCRLVVRSSGSTRVVNLPLKKLSSAFEQCHIVSHTVTHCHTTAQWYSGTVRCRSLWKNACRDTCSRPRDTCGDCRPSLVKGFGGLSCSHFFVFFLMNVICNMIDHPKPIPSKTFSQFSHSNVFFTAPHPTIHESFTMYQWVAWHVCFIMTLLVIFNCSLPHHHHHHIPHFGLLVSTNFVNRGEKFVKVSAKLASPSWPHIALYHHHHQPKQHHHPHQHQYYHQHQHL